MFGDNTDESWKKIGEIDPYYGVLTVDKFRKINFDDEARMEFFNSGKEHMDALLKNVEKRFGEAPNGRALDFGCGVGRLTLPLALMANYSHVVGVDISESMLTEARNNADKLGIRDIEFVISDDSLTQVKGEFDFVHSFIVFQHIPVKRGERIIRQLVNRLLPGGIAALHVPFGRNVIFIRKFANYIRVNVRGLHVLGNIVQGRPWGEPPMQMNRYNINRILQVFYECGITDVTLDILEEGGNIGAYFLLHKPN